MAQQIQLRNDSTAGWAADNPILAQGEIGIDTTLSQMKIGDGTTAWNDLLFYTAEDAFTPLPSFLNYTQGRTHLATLNSNFGWNSQGLWFGNALGSEGADSYPVFTDFTIGQNDAVTVEFNFEVTQECNDVGLCVYLDGDTPQWQWGTAQSRIAAQFDCTTPLLLGIEEDYQGERSNIPNPGMYHVRFTYNPIGGTPVQFEYFEGTTTNTLISSLTLNQTLGAGAYRVGFAADNNNGRTYISDLSIMVNEDIPYTDTLQNANSGATVDIADFAFESDGEQSTMTIHNHDMRIQTTRDDTQDADIDINSADDVWITAFDSLELTSTDDEVRIITGQQGQNTWHFTPIGTIELPTLNSSINSGVDGTVITDSRTATFSNNYQDASIGIQTNTSVVLAVTADTSWFASYTPDTANPATITFADSTTVQTVAVYDGTSQGTAGVIFQWVGDLTKTFEETYPLTITANTYDPNNYVGITANGADWQFGSDGEIRFPSSQPSNARTGTGEVLQFGNPTQQSIITGSKPTADNPTAQRLVVAGQDGLQGTSYDGEGGDVYLWGGVGGGANGSGGDIKVDAGSGSLNGGGGTVKVRGGYSVNSNGGFVDIYAGDSSMGSGGNVNIAAGTNQSVSEAIGGSVYIYGGGSADANGGGSVGLYTYQNGKITLSGEGGEFLNDSSNANNQIATVGDIATATSDIPVTSVLYIDYLRADSYDATGSQRYPFKTLAAAVTEAETMSPSGTNPIRIVLVSGNTSATAETLTITNGHIFIVGEHSSGTHAPILWYGQITFNGSSASISDNHFSMSGLMVNAVSGTTAITFTGTNPQRLFLKDLWLTGNGAADAMIMNNSGTGSTVHGNDVKFSHNGTGHYHAINILSGTANMDAVETSGALTGIFGVHGSLNLSNSEIDSAGSYGIDVYSGGTLSAANCKITTTAADSFGIKLASGGAAIVGNTFFNVPAAGAARAISGVSGSFLYYLNLSFTPGGNDKISSAIASAPLDTTPSFVA